MMTLRRRAGFKSDQHLAAATRPSCSPYFLPSPPLHLSLLFSNLSIPCYCCPCHPLLLTESSLVTGEDNQEQVRQWRLSWGCAASAGTREHRRGRYMWGVRSCVVALAVGQQCAQGGEGCPGESCFTWGCWQRALGDAPLWGEAAEKTLWGATDWVFVRYSWMWPQSIILNPEKMFLILDLKNTECSICS